MKISELKLNNIAILWFWLEGKSTLAFLLKVWVKIENITILDKSPISEEYKNYHSISWDSYLDNLWEFDIIFKSPWISPYHKKISPYRDKLYSNTQLFFENYDAKIIWVTATKGKSTTVTILYNTLSEAWYRVKLVGNIWTPVLDEIDLLADNTYDYIIYELSSYMLETFAPQCYIGILGNIYPCHLDWHNNDFDTYKNAKLNVLRNSQYKIINSEFLKYIPEWCNDVITFWNSWDIVYQKNSFTLNWKEILKDVNISLPWVHNRINICSVIAALNIIWKFDNFLPTIKKVLSDFRWLPHRLENIWTYKWIIFIDDGISVTPQSTIEAIKSFDQNIWTLILWGKNTGMDTEWYENLKEQIFHSKIENVILLPETWDYIYSEASNLYLWESAKIIYKNRGLQLYKTDNMKDVIAFAYKNTPKWKICLLSNAAQSYNLWKSYIEKWNEFKNQVIIQSKP